MSPLRVEGEDFIDEDGKKVRFWGVNLVSFYPDHETADNTANVLADRGFNMVRPHHCMRRSRDWNWDDRMPGGALAKYVDNSRDPDPMAWDRFDYLNAALRKKGIYLCMALRWSRSYHPNDVDILKTTDADRDAWKQGMDELNKWHWRKSIDARKALPMIDERVSALEVEFTRRLLNHANPYTKITYGRDPQVATLEVINEFSSEYTFVCGNKLPEYFKKKMNKKWEAYAKPKGVSCSFWSPKTHNERMTRLKFMRYLDEQYFAKMSAVARECGYKGPITFSNLWRGDHNLEMHAQIADHMEDHMYADPFVVDKAADFFYSKSQSMLRGKPYIIGEFNQTENANLRKKRAPFRTMISLAAASYASFHNWSGIIWFAWQHGERSVGKNGLGKKSSRKGSGIGDIVNDEMLLDHMRTAGLIYRNGYVRESDSQQTMYIQGPYLQSDYHGLMRGKFKFKHGWQNIHSIRKTFGPEPANQKNADWMTQDPKNPLVSDTGEIVKNTDQKTLTFVAPKAEGFSGFRPGLNAGKLKFMQIRAKDGFATIMAVSLDGKDLAKSDRILISKTFLSPDGIDDSQAMMSVKASGDWLLRITRPSGWDPAVLSSSQGWLRLPNTHWHECELIRQK